MKFIQCFVLVALFMRKVSYRDEIKTRLALGFVGLAARLPISCVQALAAGAAAAGSEYNKHVREISDINIRLCLPEMAPDSRADLVERNLRESYLAAIDRFRIWSLTKHQLREQVEVKGLDFLHQYLGKTPLILLCPHFLSLEALTQRMTLEGNCIALYRQSANVTYDHIRRQARQRFNEQKLFATTEPLHKLVRLVRNNQALFLMPDLDCGASGTVFSPFFGIPASTAKTAAWCAQRIGATILPLSVARVGGHQYKVEIYPPLNNLGVDLLEGTGLVNKAIEALIAAQPEQYWWGHTRFASRPPSEPEIYSLEILEFAKRHLGWPG